MAGTNSPSVIWVAGETTGYNQEGTVVTISGVLDEPSASESYVDAAVGVLHDRLVASGILES